jgi:hypothetical protein
MTSVFLFFVILGLDPRIHLYSFFVILKLDRAKA